MSDEPDGQEIVASSPPRDMRVTGVADLLVDVDKALAMWKAFEDFKKRMLVPWGKKNTDFQRIKVSQRQPDGNWKTVEKDFPKKSAARKFAKFFGISDRILEKVRVDRDDGSFVWSYTVEAWAPNGQIVTAEGVCDSKEKKSKKLEHDVKTTAHTRAKSRAIFDIAGGGDVSAEEIMPGGETSEKQVLEAEYEVKEPERPPGIGPPPKQTSPTTINQSTGPTTLNQHAEKQELPQGVASLNELEGIFRERLPGFEEMLNLVPYADDIGIEPQRVLDEEIVNLVDYMVVEMGGGQMARAGLHGPNWHVPMRKKA